MGAAGLQDVDGRIDQEHDALKSRNCRQRRRVGSRLLTAGQQRDLDAQVGLQARAQGQQRQLPPPQQLVRAEHLVRVRVGQGIVDARHDRRLQRANRALTARRDQRRLELGLDQLIHRLGHFAAAGRKGCGGEPDGRRHGRLARGAEVIQEHLRRVSAVQSAEFDPDVGFHVHQGFEPDVAAPAQQVAQRAHRIHARQQRPQIQVEREQIGEHGRVVHVNVQHGAVQPQGERLVVGRQRVVVGDPQGLLKYGLDVLDRRGRIARSRRQLVGKIGSKVEYLAERSLDDRQRFLEERFVLQ